ncbi:MAG: hypothetical protein ACRD3D_03840 [Terriglobia bacterium]
MRVRRAIPVLLFGLCLAGVPRPSAAAVVAAPAANASVVKPAAQAKSPAPRSSHENLFDWINFILLVVVLVYLLRKPLAHFFSNRSREIEHALAEGRKALQAAQAQLAEAETKLERLEQEIAGYRASAAEEREREIEKVRRASEQEGERILESARSMIASATEAARIEIKRVAATQAVALAEKIIRSRLDDPRQAALVNRFIEGIRKD